MNKEIISICISEAKYVTIECDTDGVMLSDLSSLDIAKQVCTIARKEKSNNKLFADNLLIFIKLRGFSHGVDMFLWKEGEYNVKNIFETTEEEFAAVVTTLNIDSLPYLTVDMYARGKSSKVNPGV